MLAGMKRWGKAFVLACMFAGGMSIATTASAARTINSLPWTENFNSNNYSDLVWVTQGATHNWSNGSGFRGSGAAKFTPPNAEGYSGIGQVVLASNLQPTRLNVRFLIYHGRSWSQLSGGGKLMILNRDGNRGRPMLIYGEYPATTGANAWDTLAPCDGTVCRFQGGDYWSDGTDAFRVGNGSTGRSNEWISVEVEANTAGAGTITLYIDTQDGRLSGQYITRPMDDTGGGGVWRFMDILGGYMNRGSTVSGDPENYFMIDELAFSTTRIGPPANFRSADVRPNPPASLQVQ
jgi:hypothetical protein